MTRLRAILRRLFRRRDDVYEPWRDSHLDDLAEGDQVTPDEVAEGAKRP